MAFRKNFALLLPSLLLLLLPSKVCRADESHDCPPSSCGSIKNISYPFRLKDYPKKCGDPSYELGCENNQTTFYLNSKRFLVLSISYQNFTVRLVDPGLAKYQGYSSCPIHYLTSDDIYSNRSYDTYSYDSDTYRDLNKVLIYVSCSSRLNSSLYYESAFCGDSTLSTHQNYSCAFLRDYPPRFDEIEDSCSVERVTLVSKNATVVGNTQFSNYSYGFELLWYDVYCRHCRFGCIPDLEKSTVVCGKDNSKHYCNIWSTSDLRPTFQCMKDVATDFIRLVRSLPFFEKFPLEDTYPEYI